MDNLQEIRKGIERPGKNSVSWLKAGGGMYSNASKETLHLFLVSGGKLHDARERREDRG